ncbi:hypothetical protein CEP52_003017 [Fusarium oligoseptatum]|uniref:Uncharacterized protein n=1 Tax=Fusarium oligoseptatum TaxID=2604345 RepID=A0A428UB17_9HYPO|nr:hypothetical protein CEP52_003017 [Fusarium oligoseptatum]
MTTAAHGSDMSTSWPESPRLGHFTGSVFASAVIKTLTSTTSPLLDDETSDAKNEESLQPDEPTPQQTETYNEFCQSILEVCETRVTSLWNGRTFTFNRWDALEIIPPATENATDKKPEAVRTAEPSSTGDSFIDEMTRSIHQKDVPSMARLFLQTCPGDENRGWGPLAHGMLSRALEDDLPLDELEEVAGMICFRWESPLIADYLVETFNLPKPKGQIYILWDSLSGGINNPLYHTIFHKLAQGGFPPLPAKNQGPPFLRFLFYLTAAVSLTNLPEPSTLLLIDKLTIFMAKAKEFYE